MNQNLFQNHLWQSDRWEQFQHLCGNKVFRIDGVLVIERGLRLGRVFFEVPRAEVLGLSKDFWRELGAKAKERNAVFTRVFPLDQILTSEEKTSFMLDAPRSIFHASSPNSSRDPGAYGEWIASEISSEKGGLGGYTSGEKNPPSPLCEGGEKLRTEGVPEIFPEHTLVIDLRQTEGEILSQMKSKGRYNIRLAQRKGVEVSESDDVSAFYRLLKETTERDGFSGHGKEVYEHMLESFGGDGVLLLARYEGEVIAGGIFVFCGDVATYYYGVSSNRHRSVMAPYVVQWRAIEEAKKRGCRWYDFLGIAPSEVKSRKLKVKSGEDLASNTVVNKKGSSKLKEHRLAGVSGFKEKFGGMRVKYAPAFEVVHSGFWDAFFRMLRKVRGIFG